MAYVEKNLMKDETVVKTGKVHWFIYIPAVLVFAFSFAFKNQGSDAVTPALIVFSIGMLIRAIIIRKTTEFAITNRRVIAKTGFISRDTIEINMSKVEGLGIKQGVFGRIFNFGVVTVNGTGKSSAPFKFIKDPLSLRMAVNEQIGDRA